MLKEDFAKLKKVPEDSPEGKLCTILDNIDTASDAFKPDKSAYVDFIYNQIAKVQEIIISDGYEMYYYDEVVDFNSRDEPEEIPTNYISETDLNKLY